MTDDRKDKPFSGTATIVDSGVFQVMSGKITDHTGQKFDFETVTAKTPTSYPPMSAGVVAVKGNDNVRDLGGVSLNIEMSAGVVIGGSLGREQMAVAGASPSVGLEVGIGYTQVSPHDPNRATPSTVQERHAQGHFGRERCSRSG